MLTKEQLAIIKAKNPELLKKPIDSLPRGEIIGAVTLDSVDDKMISPWDDEYQWHFRLSDAELLEEPIPCRGVLNFFDYKKYLNEEENNNPEENNPNNNTQDKNTSNDNMQDKNNTSNNNKTENTKKENVSPGILPHTGNTSILLIAIAIVSIIGIVSYIKIKKYKDVK